MPSPFQQYTQGIAPVQGMSEAGANIGKFAQQGLSSMGANLAEGIQEYQKNSALNDLVTSRGEQVASQLAYYHQIASQSPENSALLPILDKQIDSLKKLHASSLTQKRAIVDSAEVALNQFLPNFQLNQATQAQRAQADFSRAMEGTKDTQSKDSDFYVQSNPINPTLPVSAQVDEFLKGAYNQRAKNGAASLVPDDELLARWTNANKKAISDATAKGQLPADVSGRLTDQLDSLSKYRGNEMTTGNGTNPEDVTDYAKEAKLYETINTPAYKKPPVKPANVVKANENKADTAYIDQQIKQVDELLKSGNYVPTGVVRKGIQRAGSEIDPFVDWINEQSVLSQARIAKRILGKPIDESLAGNAVGMINGTPLGALGDLSNQFFGNLISPIIGKDLTKKEEDVALNAYRNAKRMEEEGKLTDTSIDPERRIELLRQKKTELEAERKKLLTPTVTTPSGTEVPAVAPSPVGGGMLLAGKQKVETPLTVEEKRKEVQGWYQKEYGYIPSSFNQIWQQYNPAPPKITKDVQTGTYWLPDGKGGHKQVTMPTPPSVADTSLARAVQFGTWNENGQPVFEERAKGILASGILRSADPKAEAPEFEKKIRDTADVRRLVKELLPYYDSKLNSLRPEKYQEVVPILNKLRAAIRPEIIGTGQQNEAERKQVIEAVGSPEKFFSWLGAEKSKLLKLEQMQMEGLQSEGKRFSVQIEFRDDQNDEGMIRNLRQQKALSQPR